MGDRLTDFVQSRPKLLLFLLTPGIMEYLSGSSPMYFLVLNPFVFLYQFAVNAALYLPGALLIREAMVRWKKGWGSVLLLGGAYGILEEGLAFGTLFKTTMGPLGGPESYGHWLGVSWVWLVEVIPLHMIFSIALPILLLGLALPETRGKSLLRSRRSLGAAGAILGLDVALNLLIAIHVGHTSIGWPLFGLCVVSIGILVVAARVSPPNVLRARGEGPGMPPILSLVLGASVYSSILFAGIGPSDLNLPTAVTTLIIVALFTFYLLVALRALGRARGESQLVMFSLGLIMPVMVVGMASQFFFPLVLVLDAAAILFFRSLWRKSRNHSALVA